MFVTSFLQSLYSIYVSKGSENIAATFYNVIHDELLFRKKNILVYFCAIFIEKMIKINDVLKNTSTGNLSM